MGWRILGKRGETHRLPGGESFSPAPAIAQRGSEHGLLRSLGTRELSGDPPIVHDKHAIGETQHFLKIAGNHDDCQAIISGKSDNQPVNLSACADVDSSSGLVHDQDARFCRQPFGDHDFLLVATGKISDSFTHVRRLDTEAFDVVFCQHFFGIEIQERPSREVLQPSHGDVLAHIHGGNQSLPAAVLGHIGDAESDRILWSSNADRTPFHFDNAGLRRKRAEDRLGQF